MKTFWMNSANVITTSMHKKSFAIPILNPNKKQFDTLLNILCHNFEPLLALNFWFVKDG